jgi:hypothetical protein
LKRNHKEPEKEEEIFIWQIANAIDKLVNPEDQELVPSDFE